LGLSLNIEDSSCSACFLPFTMVSEIFFSLLYLPCLNHSSLSPTQSENESTPALDEP
jgi:hypothetical protein